MMKVATCKELQGACDEPITGATPEEMGENSRQHVMKMVAKGDKAHIDAIEEMKKLTQEELHRFYQDFAANFVYLKDAK